MELNSKKDMLLAGMMLSILLLAVALKVFDVKPIVLPIPEANRDNPKAYYRHGNQYLFNDPGFAIPYYNRALELDPDYTDAYYQRSLAFSRVGNQEAALADLNRAIALEPGTAQYYLGRANLHRAMGNIELAIVDYDLTLAFDSSYAAAYYNRANAYYDLGCRSEALSDYEQFLDHYRQEDNIYRVVKERITEIRESSTPESQVTC